MITGEYLTFLIGEDWVFSPNTDSLGCQTFKGVSWALILGLPLSRPGPGLGQEGHLPRAPTCPGPIYDTNII